MNFFEHQETARRNTKWLVAFMLAAVLSLIAITVLAVVFALYFFQFRSDTAVSAFDQNLSFFTVATQQLSWDIIAAIALGVSSVVAIGSIFKLIQLRGGGRTIAESMGGRLLSSDTRDADEKKILNVVEEMAVASGTPVPPVYIIDENGINAFAAGFKPQDAVIGITRGCIKLLSRDELQGVVAHEFSHILHGDMRLNIRLIGVLHGILVIGLIGYFIMRSMGYRALAGRRRDNSGLAFLALGVAFIVIGYSGTFFGNIIKAAVSRQREYLADSSAVQFTRNPEGISGALKKIGGYSAGSLLHATNATEFSHMYFGQGVKVAFSGLMATHPPLQERIKRIEPRWNGRFTPVSLDSTQHSQDSSAYGAENQHTEQVSGFSNATELTQSSEPASVAAIDSIGSPSPAHVAYARNLLDALDKQINDSARDPFSARALVYCLLLDKKSDAVNQQQWQQLRAQAHPVVFNLTQKLYLHVLRIGSLYYLPLIDLCLPALKELSDSQYTIFKRNLVALIRADNKVDIFEWSLYRILIHNLEGKPSSRNHLKLTALKQECETVLSILAHSGNENASDANKAFLAGTKELGFTDLRLQDTSKLELNDIDKALDALNHLKPLQKPTLLKALASAIAEDDQVTSSEAELFRAIADSLDCPVPPLLPNQKLK
ncbi:M48 family metallopeptidase [Aurantivibrio infirmus]